MGRKKNKTYTLYINDNSPTELWELTNKQVEAVVELVKYLRPPKLLFKVVDNTTGNVVVTVNKGIATHVQHHRTSEGKRRRRTKAEIELIKLKALELREKSPEMSIAEISRRLKVSYQTLYNFFKHKQ